MPIEFRCSRCGKLLRTADDTAGRTAQCPECGAQTQVPIPATGDWPSSAGSARSDYNSPDSTHAQGYQGPYQPAPGQGPPQVYPSNTFYALKRVSAPAVCLIITAVLGLVFQVLGLLGNILHVGMFAHHPANKDFMPMFFTGPVAMGFGVLGIILTILVLIGAAKMKELESYGLAMTASILSLIPCTSPCCCLGLPFGIWAIVVLSDPVVKSSFKR